jgi:biopolymer transport protein TolQ
MEATHSSMLDLILHAGLVVKFVMLILLAASILSWTFILQRWQLYTETEKSLKKLEALFDADVDMQPYYQKLQAAPVDQLGVNAIFMTGFREYHRLLEHQASMEVILEGMRRAMHAAQNREMDRLEYQLPFLATVGSTSPYIGLFGTVWGIMTSFMALSGAQQATIQMVAPGISEALIATAVGLFAAIPAVIAYNRYSSRVERLLIRYDSFQEEFSNSIRSALLKKKGMR